MKEQISAMLDTIKQLRDQAFAAGNQQLHRSLGRAMGGLIDARDSLK